ncbi:MAG: hypothetical protein L0Y54_02880 [Sporichthyaceae bacterium]|nr:hypothetical protein [Sporichthyaceae bacterium]
MSGLDARSPDLFPVLSRGKHRNPRKGACLMELVSYLAGERWSDHPGCTHPLLAELARNVNDFSSDDNRAALAELAPEVIGLTSDDLRLDALIALRAASLALPVVAVGRQHALAVAILTCERVLAELDGRAPGELSEPSKHALAQVPEAQQWAKQFTRQVPVSPKGFRRHAAPNIVRCAARGIAQACVPDPDRLLHDLLRAAIDEATGWLGPDRAGAGTAARDRRRCPLPARQECAPARVT